MKTLFTIVTALAVEAGIDLGLSYLVSLGVNYLVGYDALTTVPVFVAVLTTKAFVAAVK